MSVRAAARCCGRRAVVRLLGARDGVRGAVVSVEKENWGGGRKKGHNGIPELPDGRLASKTTDSCFPLMLSPTGGDGNEERGRGRESESVCPGRRTERHLLSAALLSALRLRCSTRSAARLLGLCAAGDCAH